MDKIVEFFEEFNGHLLKDERPSIYFNNKLATGIFFEIYPFTMIGALISTEQEPKHHPEGNVWIHTMLVVDQCAKVKDKSEDLRAFMWAALLHDLGKATTTAIRNGRVTSYDHDKVGEELSRDFLEKCTSDKVFIEKVSKLVRWHMQTLFVVKNQPFADISRMLSETNLDEIALLSTCDRLGRGNLTEEKIQVEKENIKIFVQKCRNFMK